MTQAAGGYLPTMKRALPVLVTVALVAVAVAVVKSRESDPAPETPEGTWELDEHGTEL